MFPKMKKTSFSSMLILGGLAVHLCTVPAHAGIQEGAVALAVGNGAAAVKELTPLAEEGNALAMGLLARIYWVGGTGLTKNRELAADYAKKALPGLIKEAEAENGLAQSTLSVLYREGNGTEKDCAKAVDWAKKSANQNDAFGLNALGNLFDAAGSCLPKDAEQAAQLYRKAAEQGHGGAQYNLGWRYGNGTGLAKDDQQAVSWFRKSADQGAAVAQHALGIVYANGRGVQKDEQQAVYWYAKAAEQGDARAQGDLGFMYANGRGTEKNDLLAFQWFWKSADQGHPQGQFNLSLMYRRGLGVVKDEQQAVRWLRKAADQGFVEAQTDLGGVYANGSGVTRDSQLAYY